MDYRLVFVRSFINYNTPSAYAHLILAGTSGNALTHISLKDQPFAFTAACMLFGHGLFGVLVKTHIFLKWHHHLQNIYDWCKLTVKSFSLALMNAHLIQIHNEDNFTLYSHLASGFAPLVYGLGRKYAETNLAIRTERILDIVVLGNACSLAYFGATHEDPVTLTMAFWQILMQYGPAVAQNYIDVNRVDIETLGMSVFSLLLIVMFRPVS